MKKARFFIVFVGIVIITVLVFAFGSPWRNPDHIEYVGTALIDLFYDNIAAFNELRDVIPRNLDINDQLWVSQDTINSPLEWSDYDRRHQEQDFPKEVTIAISAFFEKVHCDRIIWYNRALRISFYPDNGFFCYFYDKEEANDVLFLSELQEGWYWCKYPDECTNNSD